MKKDLINVLKKLDSAEFRELEISIELARSIRQTIWDNRLPRSAVKQHLDVSDTELHSIMTSAKTFTVLDIARINTLHTISLKNIPVEEELFLIEYPEFNYNPDS